MNWSVKLTRIVNGVCKSINWSVEDATNAHNAKEAAVTEASEEYNLEFYAEEAEVILD